MTKINILQLISSLGVGGAEKLLIDLVNASNPDEVNFTIVVMNDYVDENLKKQLLNTGYKVYFLNRKEGHKHPKYFFKLLKIIKENKIQIIHSHNYGSKMWAILCKIFNPKIKNIFTLHCMNIFDNLNRFKLFLHKKYIDINIAISQAVLENCQQYNIGNIIQIYNGIETKKFTPASEKQNSEFKIINVSRIMHSEKGQDILIQALKICKDKGMKFKCDFVGGVHEYYLDSFEYLKNLVKELDLESEISFLGNRNDMPELLPLADLFVLPSRFEGLGLVILEAMASKVPVIASNIYGPAELIKHEENGLLFENENYQHLADKILYLYNNKEKMQFLAENAYKYIQEFDISIMYKKYDELYKDLVRNS